MSAASPARIGGTCDVEALLPEAALILHVSAATEPDLIVWTRSA